MMRPPSVLRRARTGLVAVSFVVLAGCGGLFTAQSDPGPPLPTPQASFSAGVAGTVGALTGALADAGIGLFPPTVPARPSEPSSLVQTPRALLQAAVGDPAGGYVVIYQLPDAPAAQAAATELAGYLGSGFGQTNFPVDTQFHVATLGDTVVLTWWSREKASDDELAERAFDTIATVGSSVPVIK
jgi:hypothetical protein